MLLPNRANVPIGREQELGHIMSSLRLCLHTKNGGVLYLCGKPGMFIFKK
jgi:hypothetical protein